MNTDEHRFKAAADDLARELPLAAVVAMAALRLLLLPVFICVHLCPSVVSLME